MSSRIWIKAAAGLALAIGIAWAPLTTADNNALQQHKLSAVRDALIASAGATDVSVLEDAALRAHALTSVQIDSLGAAPVVRFGLSDSALYAATMSDSQRTLVIDFYDTVALQGLQTSVLAAGASIVDARTQLLSLDPQFVTRTELDLSVPCGYSITRKAGYLVVTLDPGDTTRHAGTTPMASAIAKATVSEMSSRGAFTTRALESDLEANLYQMAQANEAARVDLLQAQLVEVAPVAHASNHEQTTDRYSLALSSQTRALRALESNYRDALAQRARVLDEVGVALNSDGLHEADRAAAIQRVANFQSYFTVQMHGFIETATQQLQSGELLARKIDQHGAARVAQVQAIEGASGLEQLDSAFAQLRETSSPDRDIEDNFNALDAALQSVASAKVDLPVERNTTLAALAENDTLDLSAAAPPAKRTRPLDRSTRERLLEKPYNMAVLVASPEEFKQAKDDGIIVLAQQSDSVKKSEGPSATPLSGAGPSGGPRRYTVPQRTSGRPQFNLYRDDIPSDQDPLRQVVDVDFRDMELTNVIGILALQGKINVIGGEGLDQPVTAQLKNLPLGKVMEIVLRMHDMGIVEEAGVYRVTSYTEAISAQRETNMVFLKNAQAAEVKETLDEVLTGSDQSDLVSVSANPSTNVVILAGPREAIDVLEGIVAELDRADPVIPTITMPIKLNYSDPTEIVAVITPFLGEGGTATADVRSRHVIVTATPVKVQEVQALIGSIDLPVKQVTIDAMIVDALLDDDAQTGVEWFLQSASTEMIATESTFENDNGALTFTSSGDVVPDAGMLNSFLPASAGSQIFFNVLSGSLDLSGLIAAEVASNNAELLANPSLVTLENKPAIINITSEFPYQELTQSAGGGQLGTTSFKEIGTILEVNSRVTHDSHIITEVDVKQSSVVSVDLATGVPIEAKRQANTNARLADGQTIFIGGLRSFDERMIVRKVPIIGDIPILNFFFSSKRNIQTNKELLIFLTCSVLPDEAPDLTPYQKGRYDKLGGTPQKVDSTRGLVESYIHPEEMRDPFYKWRRTKGD